jgi:hypothetical protein
MDFKSRNTKIPNVTSVQAATILKLEFYSGGCDLSLSYSCANWNTMIMAKKKKKQYMNIGGNSTRLHHMFT